MKTTKSRGFQQPDERRDFKGHGHADFLNFENGLTIWRGTFEPGWSWTNDVKPIVGTQTCEAPHSGYCVEGEMKFRMNDGEEFTIHAGEAFQVPPGHIAWVEEGARCVLIDVSSAQYATAAKKKVA